MKKYMTVARVSLSNALQYKGNVLGSLCFYALFIYIFFNLWRAIYEGGEVAGYTLNQIVWYLCFTELIVFGCRTSVFSQMNDDVRSGAVAYSLSRPYHYVFFQFANALGGIAFGFCVFLLAAAALGFLTVGPLVGFQFWHFPFVLLSAALGIVIQFFLHLSIGFTAFKFEDNGPFILVFQKLVFMLGMFIPLEFLPEGIAQVARFLPFSYVTWAPSRLFVAFSWEFFLQVVPVQLAWAAGAVGLSLFLFGRSARAISAHGG